MRPSPEVLSFCRAACNGELDSARSWLQQHPDLAETSVHVAAAAADPKALAALLTQAPQRAGEPLLEHWPPLLLLCLSGFCRGDAEQAAAAVKCARLLVEAGADPSIGAPHVDMPSGRVTPLLAAVQGGNEALAEVFLEFVSAADADALILAAASRQWSVVENLLAEGASWNEPAAPRGWLALHWVLDRSYDSDLVEELLRRGAQVGARVGDRRETALHVATRRRRLEILDTLLAAGADLEAVTAGGLTAYRHAVRRNFGDVAALLEAAGADTRLSASDDLARALHEERLEDARNLLESDPDLATSDNPEEARLLADLAAAGRLESLRMLLDAGADPGARGLDHGTALHQAAWFGQPGTAKLLIERGAPLDARGDHHDSTPLGWAAHGSRFSGGAAERQQNYLDIARMLLEAGAPLPGPRDRHDRGQFADATDAFRTVLAEFGWAAPDPG